MALRTIYWKQTDGYFLIYFGLFYRYKLHHLRPHSTIVTDSKHNSRNSALSLLSDEQTQPHPTAQTPTHVKCVHYKEQIICLCSQNCIHCNSMYRSLHVCNWWILFKPPYCRWIWFEIAVIVSLYTDIENLVAHDKLQM
jgi:hypothetical protein